MTTPLDLDALRQRWRTLDRPLDTSLAFDAAALRASLSQRMVSAFRRHSAWLLAGLAFDAVALVALGACVVAFAASPALLLSSVALVLLAVMETATDLHAWRTLRHLDFDAPVLALRDTLAALRARRLRTTGAIILFSIALWLPFLSVLLAALTGIDLFAHLHWSVTVGNLVGGLLFVPLGAWIGRVVARRFCGEAGFEQFMDDAAGRSWSAARQRWQALADTDTLLARGDGEALLGQQRGRDTLAREFAAPLRALRRAMWIGIVLLVPPLLAVAAFNAGHGGQPRAMVPGLLLHFALLAHLVANIAHLHAVARLDLGAPPQRIATTLRWMALRRERLARGTVIVAPLLLLPLLAVLLRAVAGIDVFASLPTWALIGTVPIAIVACMLLARTQTQQLVDLVCTGALRRTRTLADALDTAPPPDDGS